MTACLEEENWNANCKRTVNFKLHDRALASKVVIELISESDVIIHWRREAATETDTKQ